MVKFKNKQLSIRNRELRSELNIAESRINRLVTEKYKIDTVWGVVGQKWSQLDSELSLLLGQISTSAEELHTDSNSTVLSLLEVIHGGENKENMDVDSDEEDPDKVTNEVVNKVKIEVDNRSKFTVQVVKSILQEMSKSHSKAMNDDTSKREFKIQAKMNALIKQVCQYSVFIP